MESFERNEYGHIVLIIEGFGFTGGQEIAKLKSIGCSVDEYAARCLTSGEYNTEHRLLARKYKIALVPVEEAGRRDEPMGSWRKYGKEKYGYQNPPAGIAPRFRYDIANELMRKMRFGSIVPMHNVIKDFGGRARMLHACRGPRPSGERWLHAFWIRENECLDDLGAVAYLVPAS